MTLSPMWQSCAKCTYDIKRQLRPTVVLKDCDVPRFIMVYSRIIVPSPISTVVSSPANLRSCGGPPRIVPIPTWTFWPSVTFLSRVALGAMRQPLGTMQFSPMMAYAPTSTSDATSASGEMIADGWIRGGVIGLAPSPPCRLPRRRGRPLHPHRAPVPPSALADLLGLQAGPGLGLYRPEGFYVYGGHEGSRIG